MTLPLSTALAASLPSGGQVVGGAGSIDKQGNRLTVEQQSHNLAIEWSDFSIGEGNTVHFQQPSADAAALNRVTGNQVSSIRGALSATGRVFLVNPNGVHFSASAQVDVGSLVASTLDISTADFMAGNYAFEGGSGNAVINAGNITSAPGGHVAMIAAEIINTGTIDTPRGSTLLGAGNRVTLDLGGTVKIEVEEARLETYIEQGGAIRADGGLVYLTAKAADELTASVINHTGITEARTLASNAQGEIMLMGDMDSGSVQLAGSLDASAPAELNPDGGDGGFIETSAAKVRIADEVAVTTRADHGKTGHWLIDPTDFTVSGGSGNQTASGIGADTLSTTLVNSNITLETAAEGDEAGNIYVNAAVSWDANTTLTLDAHNDIQINAAISAESGGLSLNAEGNITSSAAINVDLFELVNGDWLQSGSNLSEFSANDFRLHEDAASFRRVLGGDGSSASPYQIVDVYGLQGMASHSLLGDRFALAANIDASGTAGWNGGEGFNPIGDGASNFSGVFDGNGHVIHTLSVNRPDQDDVGLFGAASSDSVIRRVGVQDARITGDLRVGGLTGVNHGSISQSFATGEVNGDELVGGLVGRNYGTVQQSYAIGQVGANRHVGGLVGSQRDTATIEQSYAASQVSGSNNLGALVGYNWGGTIMHSYATGNVGDLVGWEIDGSVGDSDVLTTEQMFDPANLFAFEDGSSNAIWGNADNQTTPYLIGLNGNRVFNRNDLAADPATNLPALYTAIQTLDQLQAVNQQLADNYVLVNNIDASATASWNGGQGFDPIGDSTDRFTGVFDGLGHSISNLTIDRLAQTHIGLFGINDGTLRDLALSGGSIVGGAAVGSLAGENSGSIVRSYATGSVGGQMIVGGLVGLVSGGTIQQSYAAGDVSAAEGLVGGLAGQIESGTVSQSHATGRVEGELLVGGLVGSNWGAITQSYATGEVHGLEQVGGLVGANEAGDVVQSYSTGRVEGESDVGGLMGFDQDGNIEQSYWNTETSGQSTSAGGTGLTTEAMFDAANLFAFEDEHGNAIWGNADNRTTPYLMGLGDNRVFNRNDVPADPATDRPALYTAIQTLEELQNVEQRLAANYVLVNSIDASSADRFDAIGSFEARFTGTFDGLGHVISGLSIGSMSIGSDGRSGLFDTIGSSGLVRDLGLEGGQVLSRSVAGMLAGSNYGSIQRSYAVGGEVMSNNNVGGLVGRNYGSIEQSYAAVAVEGGEAVGGLVGRNQDDAIIEQSYATGHVTGNSAVNRGAGGLVGVNQGSVVHSYATGDVTSIGKSVGGLVGVHGGSTISQSYATGSVTGGDEVGGLVGKNSWRSIEQSFYATTDADGNPINVGLEGVGGSAHSGAVGKTLAELQDLETFAAWDADIDAAGGSGSVWRIYDGHSTPLLRTFLTELTAAVTDDTVTYSGATQTGDADWSISGPYDDSLLWGERSVTGGGRNAGSYSLGLAGLYSGQQGYDLIVSEGTLTIEQATLTLEAVSDSRVYDGTTRSDATVSVSGLVGDDEINGLSQSFDSRNAGIRQLIVNKDFVLDDGNGGNNYAVVTQQADGSIEQATLTLEAMTDSRVYDGTTRSDGAVKVSGLMDEDEITDLSQSFDSRNAGNRQLAVDNDYILEDGNNGNNYVVVTRDADGLIERAQAIVTANSDTVTYNGQEQSVSGFTVDGLVGGDDESVLSITTHGGSGTGVGSYVHSASGNADNYTLTFIDGELKITRRPEPQPDPERFFPDSRAVNTSALLHRQSGSGLGESPTGELLLQVEGTGIRLPDGTDDNEAANRAAESYR